jgi:hypothetical protein
MDTGYLLISDITGYTAFLTGSELDHANAILKSFFETLLARHTLPLRVTKLEGDAIFAYLPDGQVYASQAILDAIQSLYAGFRMAQESMRLNTTCTCRACRNIPNLDLKFFIHYGEYIVQSLGGSIELSGPDVILIHRLLKNTVTERTGLRAYALFTQAACGKINAPDFEAGLLPHSEHYEYLGETHCRLFDLHAFWEAEKDSRQARVTPGEAEFTLNYHLPAPPAVIWDLMTNPQTRVQIMHAASMNISERQAGRIGPGSTYHCDHGTDVTRQQILSWQPFELLTTADHFELPMIGTCILTNSWHLKPDDDNTELTICYATLRSEHAGRQALAHMVWKIMGKKMINQGTQAGFESIQRLLRERGWSKSGQL